MSDELPPPDFTLDGGDSPCYYATTVRAAIAAAVARERARCLAEVETGIWVDKSVNEILDSIAAAIRGGD